MSFCQEIYQAEEVTDIVKIERLSFSPELEYRYRLGPMIGWQKSVGLHCTESATGNVYQAYGKSIPYRPEPPPHFQSVCPDCQAQAVLWRAFTQPSLEKFRKNQGRSPEYLTLIKESTPGKEKEIRVFRKNPDDYPGLLWSSLSPGIALAVGITRGLLEENHSPITLLGYPVCPCQAEKNQLIRVYPRGEFAFLKRENYMKNSLGSQGDLPSHLQKNQVEKGRAYQVSEPFFAPLRQYLPNSVNTQVDTQRVFEFISTILGRLSILDETEAKSTHFAQTWLPFLKPISPQTLLWD